VRGARASIAQADRAKAPNRWYGWAASEFSLLLGRGLHWLGRVATRARLRCWTKENKRGSVMGLRKNERKLGEFVLFYVEKSLLFLPQLSPKSVFLPQLQNRTNHLPQLFKPCILPPSSGFEGDFATLNDVMLQ
jgi:hypothetical protein